MIRTLVALVSCVALSACAGDPPAVALSRSYVQEANYFQAYAALIDALDETPDDPELKEELRQVQIGFFLDQGQQLVFNDQEAGALERFQRVIDLDPQNTTARSWVDKCKWKLAEKATAAGDALRAQGDLDDALLRYQAALQHVTDFELATEGVRQVAETWSERRSEANESYSRAVDALGEQLLPQAWYHLSNALERNPKHSRAGVRSPTVEARIRQSRMDRAVELQDEGHYEAALREFEALVEEGWKPTGIDERIAATKVEVEASKLVRDGEMAAFRGEFPKARKLLEEASEKTVTRRPQISELLLMVRDKAFEKVYSEARFLATERQYDEALAKFRSIDAEFENGYRDVKTRISSLETQLDIASKAYQRGLAAEQAGDLDGAIDAYGEVALVCPGYRDSDERLQAVQRKKTQADAGEAAREPSGETSGQPSPGK